MKAATAIVTMPLTTIPSGLLTKYTMMSYPRGLRPFCLFVAAICVTIGATAGGGNINYVSLRYQAARSGTAEGGAAGTAASGPEPHLRAGRRLGAGAGNTWRGSR